MGLPCNADPWPDVLDFEFSFTSPRLINLPNLESSVSLITYSYFSYLGLGQGQMRWIHAFLKGISVIRDAYTSVNIFHTDRSIINFSL